MVRYLLILLTGTLLVYFGAPLVQEQLSAAGDEESPESRLSQPPPTGSAQQTAVTGEHAVPHRQEPTQQQAAPRREAPLRREQPPAPPVVVQQVRGYTPATERIPASGRNTTHWGVTLVTAPVYDKDGKRRDLTLEGGTLVEQVGSASSSKGEMAVCRVWRNGHWVGPWLIATADLMRFAGGREQVDADEFELLVQYCGFNARLEARRKELHLASVNANPHAEPLRELKAKHDAARKRSAELTSKRNQATGHERTVAGDELRRLKEEVAHIEREMKTLVRQYEDWKEQHGVAPATAAQRDDPQIRELTSRLEALRGRLRNFGL